jgi:hypothetical protein
MSHFFLDGATGVLARPYRPSRLFLDIFPFVFLDGVTGVLARQYRPKACPERSRRASQYLQL